MEESRKPTEVEFQVLRVFDRDRDRIVRNVLEAIRDRIPTYSNHPDPELAADLADHIAKNLSAFLASTLEGRQPTRAELAFVGDAIERRVSQGVPLDQVLHAFRVGHQALWEMIVDESRNADAGPEVALALALPAMLYIDAASLEVAEAYVHLEQERKASVERNRASLVAAMIEGHWPPERTRRSLGDEFPLAAETAYLTLVANATSEGSLTVLRSLVEKAVNANHLAGGAWSQHRDELVVILAIGESEPAAAADLFLASLGVSEGAVPGGSALGVGNLAVGPPEVADSYREAVYAARSAEPGGYVSMPSASLLERIAVMLPAGCAPRRLVDSPLRAALNEAMRDSASLIDTVLVYAGCDLNARRTAAQLYLHPNTVLYRLRQLGKLVGLDLQRVPNVLDLVAAIRILRADAATSLRDARD